MKIKPFSQAFFDQQLKALPHWAQRLLVLLFIFVIGASLAGLVFGIAIFKGIL